MAKTEGCSESSMKEMAKSHLPRSGAIRKSLSEFSQSSLVVLADGRGPGSQGKVCGAGS